MNEQKSALAAWYDQHIVAGWYASYAMWLGLLGTMLPVLLDGAQLLLDHWPETAQALDLSSRDTLIIQLVIATLIPPARAWQQRSMQAKALKQAAITGAVSSQVGTPAVLVAVEGVDPFIVQPSSPVP